MKLSLKYSILIIVLVLSGLMSIHDAFLFFNKNEGIQFYGGWPWGFIVGTPVLILTMAYVGSVAYFSYKALKDKSKVTELKDRPNR